MNPIKAPFRYLAEVWRWLHSPQAESPVAPVMEKAQIVTTRTLIQNVVWRISERACRHERGSRRAKEYQSILINLTKLNLATCSADEVDDIIGNSSFTTITCHACDKHVNAAAVLPDSSTLCLECVEHIAAELRQAINP